VRENHLQNRHGTIADRLKAGCLILASQDFRPSRCKTLYVDGDPTSDGSISRLNKRKRICYREAYLWWCVRLSGRHGHNPSKYLQRDIFSCPWALRVVKKISPLFDCVLFLRCAGLTVADIVVGMSAAIPLDRVRAHRVLRARRLHDRGTKK
jgi:hypothetical protein